MYSYSVGAESEAFVRKITLRRVAGGFMPWEARPRLCLSIKSKLKRIFLRLKVRSGLNTLDKGARNIENIIRISYKRTVVCYTFCVATLAC